MKDKPSTGLNSNFKEVLKPRIFIDGDAFPYTEISIDIARLYGISVIVSGNMTQNLQRFEGIEGVEVLEVSDEKDSADFAILNRLASGDIILTQDTGLAAVALAKGARVLDIRGCEFEDGTIDLRLMKRHFSRLIRLKGGKSKGPKQLTPDDRERFAVKLGELLSDLKLK